MTKFYTESLNNKTIKLALSLKERKNRRKTGLFIAEGERLVNDIPDDWEKKYMIYSESYDKANEINDGIIIPDRLFEKISDTVTPQGIMAICRKKEYNRGGILKKIFPFIVILDGVSDPGNLGTIIRTADACGVDAVFMTKGCADLYNPKTVRAAMASIFHIPVITDCDIISLFEEIKKNNIKISASHLKGKACITDIKLYEGCAVVIGNEANGISDEAARGADILFKIPMRGKAESLNASAACAMILYEAVRQIINAGH